MAKKKIVLEFIFEDKEDEIDPDWSRLELVKVKLGKATTLTEDERDTVTERWGQSDKWHVDIHNDILHVIDSGQSVSYD